MKEKSELGLYEEQRRRSVWVELRDPAETDRKCIQRGGPRADPPGLLRP